MADLFDYDLASLIYIGFIFVIYGLIIYCAYHHPINNGNRGLSVVLAFVNPFIYIIWRAVERPLSCSGYNSGLSLIFGLCLPPCFVMSLLCENEQSSHTSSFVILQKV